MLNMKKLHLRSSNIVQFALSIFFVIASTHRRTAAGAVFKENGVFTLNNNEQNFTSINSDVVWVSNPGYNYPWKLIAELVRTLRQDFNHKNASADTNNPNIFIKNLYTRSEDSSSSEERSNSNDLSTTTNAFDACPSEKAMVTPFWANNSEGETLAIVNFFPFEQAVQQEICASGKISCLDNCFCEQNVAWHRLLALDSNDKRRGIFMDWFQFPSSCSCRCRTSKKLLPPMPKSLLPTPDLLYAKISEPVTSLTLADNFEPTSVDNNTVAQPDTPTVSEGSRPTLIKNSPNAQTWPWKPSGTHANDNTAETKQGLVGRTGVVKFEQPVYTTNQRNSSQRLGYLERIQHVSHDD